MTAKDIIKDIEASLDNARHSLDKAHFFNTMGSAEAVDLKSRAIFEAESSVFEAEMDLLSFELKLI